MNRQRAIDIALTAAYLFAALVLGLLSSEPPHTTPLWSMALLTVAGIAVLSVRRRHARLAFWAALVLTLLSLAYGTGAELVLVLVMLYSAGVTRSSKTAWLSLAITVGVAALGSLVVVFRLQFGPSFWGTTLPGMERDALVDWGNSFVILTVPSLIAALLGINVGHRRNYVGSLVERAEQMERERDQQAEIAAAQERERIAREMHDVIAHSLSVMIAMADGARASVQQRPREAEQAIGRVAETGRRTLDEVRRVLGSVRGEDELLSDEHSPQPDASQLPSLITGFRQAGLPAQMTVHGRPPADRVLGLTVYRIVQESLTNVLRHGSHTRSVEVTITWSEADVTVLIEDESALAPVSLSPGRGLVGIRERAALYDGTASAGPRQGGGWRVLVRLQFEKR